MFLRSNVGFAVWFVAATMLWSLFTLQDSVLTGLRRASGARRQRALRRRKDRLARDLRGERPALRHLRVVDGRSRAVGRGDQRAARRATDPLARASDVAGARAGRAPDPAFVAADYVGGLFWIASSTLLPIVVTQRPGASANAYYTLAWVMTMPLYLATANIGSSLVVSAMTERGRLREYARASSARPCGSSSRLLSPCRSSHRSCSESSAGTTRARPRRSCACRPVGDPERRLRPLLSVWRAEQRLSLLVSVRAIQFTAVVACSIALLQPYGIEGPAIAWLVVQTIGRSIAGVPLAGSPGGHRRGPRRRLLLLAKLRNASVELGVLPAAQRRRDRPRRAQQDGAAAASSPSSCTPRRAVVGADADLDAPARRPHRHGHDRGRSSARRAHPLGPSSNSPASAGAAQSLVTRPKRSLRSHPTHGSPSGGVAPGGPRLRRDRRRARSPRARRSGNRRQAPARAARHRRRVGARVDRHGDQRSASPHRGEIVVGDAHLDVWVNRPRAVLDCTWSAFAAAVAADCARSVARGARRRARRSSDGGQLDPR